MRDPIILTPFGIPVHYSEIGNYINAEYSEALYLWNCFKLTGVMPNGAIGWANEPMDVVQSILALESANNMWERDEQEKRTKRIKDQQALSAKSKGKR